MKGMKFQMEDMTKKFAHAVHARRKELGLTQEELAKRVGTTKQMVSKYELGQRSPKVVMANAFAAALETTLDELLDTDKPDAVSEPESKQIRIVSGMMAEMTDEEKDQIVEIVYLLSKKKRKENEQ